MPRAMYNCTLYNASRISFANSFATRVFPSTYILFDPQFMQALDSTNASVSVLEDSRTKLLVYIEYCTKLTRLTGRSSKQEVCISRALLL